jgi:uncharacterized protein (TIGR03435 family)
MRTHVTVSLVIVAAVMIAVAQDMRFQTATITRNQSASLSGGSQILPEGKVIITNTPVRDLLRIVYDVPDFAIIGAPEWFASERYDITAQAARRPSGDELKQMMRRLLAEQFKLVLHQEARSMPVFDLRRSSPDGSLGPNLIPSKTSCEIGDTAACPHELTGESFTAVGMPMVRIVRTLAELAGRPVIDKTNLSGLFDVKLTWTSGASTFLAAVRDQLGLELQPRDEPAQVLVIDRVGRLNSH